MAFIRQWGMLFKRHQELAGQTWHAKSCPTPRHRVHEDDAGRRHLNQVLREGPRHIGAFKPIEKTELSDLAPITCRLVMIEKFRK